MNSPCIVVSQYMSLNHATALSKGVHDLKVSNYVSWLSNPLWSRQSSDSSQQVSFSILTEEEIMEQYRDLMFDFTFPETVDFRDLPSCQLAATRRSTVVAEHGWKLQELVEMLKQIATTPGGVANLAKSISKIETSLSEVGFWIEEQRIQQMLQEVERDIDITNLGD
ncbi:hypothetical protein RSOLAG1IB_03177 [Rhizoctonia solani AG-1 IB]|uniref:Uncharacterized protein n=1 Tax=Thanatephorus cucumeris (strain AG1-IB / isolate 7/3/14) TaxID=1108050 RepID=A0A0B7FQQ5_THACB|nr:hypothetical protein RSOLAG1IB_03177 [Rhizoctonia solani AG-1 IB]